MAVAVAAAVRAAAAAAAVAEAAAVAAVAAVATEAGLAAERAVAVKATRNSQRSHGQHPSARYSATCRGGRRTSRHRIRLRRAAAVAEAVDWEARVAVTADWDWEAEEI
jgi:hypothetical protein